MLGKAKAWIAMHLPDRALIPVKKVYYPIALRRFNIDREPDLRMVRELVAPGDHVLDIGANIGLYTSYLSRWVGREGRVTSCEPVPSTFELLTNSVTKLGLSNVTLRNVAISDAPGTAVMDVPHYASGSENYYRAHLTDGAVEPGLRHVVVRTETLDALIGATDRPVTFIKCDVEGHELACVRGAAETIRRFQPMWMLEVSGDVDDPADRACAVDRILNEAGYRTYRFDGAELRLRQPGDQSVNYFYLGDAHLERLGENRRKWPKT